MISRSLLTTFVFSAGLALSAPTFSADVIGEVEMLSVWAYGTPPDEPRRDLRARSDVHADELIETVKSAEVLIRFEDGTTLGLGAESTIYLDELVYDGGAGDSMVLTITQGFFHFVTGDIAPEAVVIETPAMIIGIRGTDLAIGVDGNGTSTVGVRDGAATATPAVGGTTVDVNAGQTATAEVGERSVSVSDGLSAGLAGPMPGGSASGGSGGRDGGGDGGGGGGSGGGHN